MNYNISVDKSQFVLWNICKFYATY